MKSVMQFDFELDDKMRNLSHKETELQFRSRLLIVIINTVITSFHPAGRLELRSLI